MPGLKSFCGIILLLTLLSCQPLRAQTFTDASQLLHPMAPIEGGFQKGASAADFNNDGLVDIYHPNGDQVGRLYLNRGEAGFFDILPEIGLVEGARLWGAAFGDFDNDAYLDIVFEDFSAPSRLYKNNRNWSFTQVNDRANVSIPSLAQGAGWGDFNLDGKLDLMVVNDAGANQLFNNLTFATFAEVTQSANVQTFGNSYGMSWGDLNNDGYPDVFVTTCHRTDPLRSIKHLLLNNGDETFTDINYSAGVADSLASWGVVWFDYDNDNDLDLYIGNSVHAPRPGFNRLYRNNGDNTFANVSFAAGVAGESDENSFGIAAADFDNDGWIDLYVTNRYRQHRLYHNNGDGTFTDIAQGAGIVEDAHKAVAVADFNNDGWIDIFTTGYPHNRLMLNDGGSNHWIAIKARGTASNYYGVGTRIEVYTDSLRQIREIRAGDSFCSQNDNLTAHFGLGGYTQIDSIVLRWPGGGVDRIRSLQEVDQTLTIVEGSGISDPPSTFALQSPTDGITLSQSADDIQFIWHNAFTLYIDAVSYTLYLKGEDLWTRATFDTSFSNIYDNYFVVGRDVFKDNHVYSWTVDVTDGFSVTASTDLWRFVVNPYGTLFTSMTSGAVVLEASQSSGTSWADYDSDGDEDLFVANSGNQKNFLFRNDGHGAFTKITEGAIVNDEASSMGCSWGDYNQDGYLDLFVANASNQNNDLYRNNGDGTFTKVTDDIMVSDGGNSIGCSWGDTDNDGYLDLFVTNTSNQKNGLYHNNGDGTFTKITAGEIVNEAFNSMGCAWGDYDADGDLDLFVANASNQ
ncbi:MAG: VCBS repeat-containing protein, partial [bacterium]